MFRLIFRLVVLACELLGASATMSLARYQPVDGSFGARMRYERMRHGISIASIAESTKITGQLLERMESNDVSRWPTGIYRRAFIRAYATSIGLDPESVVRDFVEYFPDPDECSAAQPAAATTAGGGRLNLALRLTLAESGSQFSARNLMREWRRRCQAIVIDAAVLGILAVTLSAALHDPGLPFSIAVAMYYLASILLLGNTPGVTLVSSWPAPRKKPPAASSGVPDWRAAVATFVNSCRQWGRPFFTAR